MELRMKEMKEMAIATLAGLLAGAVVCALMAWNGYQPTGEGGPAALIAAGSVGFLIPSATTPVGHALVIAIGIVAWWG